MVLNKNTMKQSIYNITIDKNLNKTLVFNSYSGAVAWIKNDYLLEKNSNEWEVSELKRTGFLVDDDIDEYQCLSEERRKTIYECRPEKLKIVIAPTLACNLSCIYCFEKDGRNLNQTMDPITWEKMSVFLTNYMSERPSIIKLNITWFGGEPCLCINEIVEFNKKIIPFCNQKHITYEARIVTNGVLLNEHNIKTLYNQCNVRYAQITVDGDEKSYVALKHADIQVYQNLLNQIEIASGFFKIDLRINVNNLNKSGIKQLLSFLLSERGLCGKINVGFAAIREWNGLADICMADNDYIDFLTGIYDYIIKSGYEGSFYPKRPLKKAIPCGLMREHNFCIDPQGIIYRCEHLLGQEQWKIGDIEKGMEMNNINKEFLDFQPMDQCRSCSIFPVCAGGCPAEKLLYGNPPQRCSYMLQYVKAQVKFAVQAKERK